MRLLPFVRFLTRDELLERGYSEFALIATQDYLPHPKPPYGSDLVHWDGKKFISFTKEGI